MKTNTSSLFGQGQTRIRRTIRGGFFLQQMGLALLVATGVAALAGCADNSQSQYRKGYSGYSAGTGVNPQNVQTNSTVPGPRYYQSSQNPYNSN